MNAFGSALEILTLYAQRPIVEKHSRYAFYHPSCEAFASMLVDLPAKVGNTIIFNLTLYFMTNLRREPDPFFFFALISFFLTLAMSMLFISIAAMSRTLAQAMVPTALFILSIIIYTGFAIPTKYMLGWFRWINYLNPVAFGFEALKINEFTQTRSSVGSVPGSSSINGDRFIKSSHRYYHANKWRNFGVIITFMIFFMLVYLLATEWISANKSRGEVLVFRRESLDLDHISTEEKLDYVDQVIKLLDMEEFADAVVGAPGEGLNVEQRKRLTIGVELAAKPQLLLFLAEPASSLDSQTSWAIYDLIENLKTIGQAILCTIHQSSAMLFQRFDRLLFLAKGGKTIYLGDIRQDSHVLTAYFEKNGAPKCSSVIAKAFITELSSLEVKYTIRVISITLDRI
ncbi:uncharacterized protein BP5553_08860 [Venustampulla echinocandica]|uniref:ABC transporter domain-containing protein n=1 Tax=Venustampulla echinocandica TaxID=2656787 RepID=A0A370TD98_9HELO|nr:uncharacterized protein BP5553_08860 [Venustampulla echinocandica]RDL32404.1 hypothetical protein BP5553_08860 [Venustampulla echinocandica]